MGVLTLVKSPESPLESPTPVNIAARAKWVGDYLEKATKKSMTRMAYKLDLSYILTISSYCITTSIKVVIWHPSVSEWLNVIDNSNPKRDGKTPTVAKESKAYFQNPQADAFIFGPFYLRKSGATSSDEVVCLPNVSKMKKEPNLHL